MRLGGKARYLIEVTTEQEVLEAIQFANAKSLQLHVIGEGSNTIFTDAGFSGLAIVNRIKGRDFKELEDSLEATVGAGENWDDLVAQTVEAGYGDIAALSKIPGTVGAAPVQNIGAYGQQISDSLISVRAFDIQTKEFKDILRSGCNFSYRHSRFNLEDKGRFIITSIKMRLYRKEVRPPFYADVEKYFAVHNIDTLNVTPADLRNAVTEIRTNKLPDPTMIANTGSFFGNPVVDEHTFATLQNDYPELKGHRTDDGRLKLYAGQLIELAGFKDYHDQTSGMATWHNQALVLVNECAKTTHDLLSFRQKITEGVKKQFGIQLDQEPELFGDDTIDSNVIS